MANCREIELSLGAADTAWLAGLLEGEGNFSPRLQVYPQVALSMTDRDVVERAANMLNIKTRRSKRPLQPNWHPQYGFRLTGARARAAMRLILPYMGERRSTKIREALNAWETRP